MPLSKETKSKIIEMIQNEMAAEIEENRARAAQAESLQKRENLGWYIKIPYLKNPYLKIPYVKTPYLKIPYVKVG